MVLFKVNTGTREQEVCGLRWDWEVEIPELNTSVFIIPDKYVKNGDDRLVVLNNIAKSIIDKQSDKNPEYVFTCEGERLGSMNNTTWQRKRILAALKMARDSNECEYIDISVVGRYLSLEWKIRSKRIGEPERVITYTVTDYDKNRLAKGLEPIAGSCRKEPNLKQLMRFIIIEQFFSRDWPEVEAFSNVRIHDLKHTYGRRLRAVGVHNETRKALLGHRNGDITTHYSAAEVEELLEATERVCNYDSRKSRTITLLRRKMG